MSTINPEFDSDAGGAGQKEGAIESSLTRTRVLIAQRFRVTGAPVFCSMKHWMKARNEPY